MNEPPPKENARVRGGRQGDAESRSAQIIVLSERRRNRCAWCLIPRALRCGLCSDCLDWALRDLLQQRRAAALRSAA